MMRLKRYERVWVVALLCVFAVLFIFPIYWTLTSSLKSREQIFKIPPEWFPLHVTAANYFEIFRNSQVPTYFFNSMIVAILTVVGTLLFSITAAFGLSYFHFKWRNFIANSILSVRIIPPLLFTIPYYVIFRNIHLTNTLTSLVICYIAVNLPFAVWLLLGFFQQVPRSIYEAGMIDGCNSYNLLTKIGIHMVLPGLITVAILVFMNSWNEFSLALTMIFSDDKKTLPIAISSMIQLNADIPIGTISAVGMIVMIPAILFSLFSQKYIVQGLTAGAVKE